MLYISEDVSQWTCTDIAAGCVRMLESCQDVRKVSVCRIHTEVRGSGARVCLLPVEQFPDWLPSLRQQRWQVLIGCFLVTLNLHYLGISTKRLILSSWFPVRTRAGQTSWQSETVSGDSFKVTEEDSDNRDDPVTLVIKIKPSRWFQQEYSPFGVGSGAPM